MLDIGIGEPGRPPLPTEPSLGLDNDGYYWFLYPLIESLTACTGQWIDLYGDAKFAGDDLLALGRMLTEARRRVDAQPETWEVHIGTQTHPVVRELFSTVHRDEFMKLFDRWERVIERAKETGRSVVCFGD